MNNNKPFDFMTVLKEKGIISSSGENTTRTKPRSTTLGKLFKDILEELATDPERKKPTYGEPSEVHNEKYEDDYYDLENEALNASIAKDEKLLKKEAAKKHKVEMLRQEAISAAKKKKEAERLQQEYNDNSDLLRQEKQALKDKQVAMRQYSKLLHKDKSSLRQAFVFTEILSKPVSLR